MKTFLKFSGIISLVLAVVAFILMMACPGVKYSVNSVVGGGTSSAAGTLCIFGGTVNNAEYKLTWAGFTAFLLIVVALIILIAAVVLPLVKVTALDKFAGILNLVAVCCLIVAGVFMFCIVSAFKTANGDGSGAISGLVSASYSIGAGWVIGGIISIVAGAVAIAPAAADFISKK